MGRRTSGAQVGLEKIGLVQANAATLTTTQANTDLTLAPNGTGNVVISNGTTVTNNITIQNQYGLRLSEQTSNGSNYIAQQAAASMTANYTITWPSAVAGAAGYVLSSDTSGNLSWINPGGSIAIADPGSVATVHYPFFGTNAGSVPTTLTGLNAKTSLSFVPSTGTLSSTAFSVTTGTASTSLTSPIHYGSSSTSGTLTLNGTSSGTKATASVLMPDNVTSSSTTTGTLVVTGGVGVSGTINAGNFTTSGTLTAGTVTETSSIALKENLMPITGALEKILQLQAWIYDRKDGSRKGEPGLIKEEVEKIIPNLVSDDGIQYTKLSAYLIEAVKELTDQIKSLQK